MNKMTAYHGKPEIKATYLARVRGHRAADQLIHGTYWGDGKGCAIGCTVHSRDHGAYETELGIPRPLAPGADLHQVSDRFLYWLLIDPHEGVIRFAKLDAERQAITRVGELYSQRLEGKTVDGDDWNAARKNCWHAAENAYAAYAATTTAAAYAADADADARQKTRVRQSEKLLELLREAPQAKS